MSYLVSYWMVSLIVFAILGLIPANIAKGKGYSFGLWWFYGWMLFLIAIIHVSLIPDKNGQNTQGTGTVLNPPAVNSQMNQSVADELKKYKELFDQGVLTEREFIAKKEQLLKLI